MRKFFSEFKEFVMRGNVMDLAVAVIIGAAFQAIINSLVNDVISPFIGLFANIDFKDWVFDINGVKIQYGSFLTALINFIIMAFVIFLLIKGINKVMSLGKRLKKDEKELPTEPETKNCPYCLSEINIKATRCPHCTSQLEQTEEEK